MFLNIGIAELLLLVVICVMGLGFPTVILILLSGIGKRIKNIEERLKDK